MLEFEPEETPFPHKEITEAIIGSAFEVYNHLGYGFLHRVYQRSLQVELTLRGFSGDLERRTTVRYKEVIVGDYDDDMIVNDVVLVEIKIAPQIRQARRSSAPKCAESHRIKDWHPTQFRSVQG
jgi:GxxExxY protein